MSYVLETMYLAIFELQVKFQNEVFQNFKVKMKKEFVIEKDIN